MNEPFLRSFQLTGLKAAEREEAEARRRAERQARYLATTPHILTEAAVAEAERQRARRPVDLMTGEESGRGQEPPAYFSIYDIDGNLVATVDPGGVRSSEVAQASCLTMSFHEIKLFQIAKKKSQERIRQTDSRVI